MKVPVSPTLGFTSTTATKSNPTTAPTNLQTVPNPTNKYEPTSVLDLQRSPSPVAKPLLDTGNNHHHLQPPPTAELDNLEGWDSILSELGLNDDNNNSKLLLSHLNNSCNNDSHSLISQLLPDFASSQPFDLQTSLPSEYTSPFPDFPHFGPSDQISDNSPPFGLDFIDDLVRAAHAFESDDSHQLNLILSRLNQRLRSPVGKPLQRAAYYFKEALQQLYTTANTATTPPRPTKLSSYDVVQTIRATKAFSGVSPVSLFSAFAANQAVLEAVDGAAFIHIVDFDIGFGGHWASFMRELVDKAVNITKLTSIVLRITAIIPEEFGVESKLVRENLSQFARELNLNFHIDFVLIPTFEILLFKSVKFIDGEKIAVHFTPSVFHRFANNSRSGISKFVADLRGISPTVVVVVDKEVGIDVGTASFAASFIAGIEFYTGMLESLDVGGGGGECVRRIETYVVRPRIVAAVKAAARAEGRRSTTWREAFVATGMRVVGFSQFSDYQAECLLRRAQIGGFHVAKRHGEMMLFWHDRPLVVTSAWKC
ncbi:hypothetical protein RND81_13G168800 [Saponaria officinalis]|uniref:Scarecrow-like protein 15 n=1 Tax=Saponaria officinalis TaxID=3572 RepID=A0AAW1H1X0_SAPOF